MAKKVSAKVGLKEGMRSIFIHAGADAIEAIDPQKLEVKTKLMNDFDYIHLFVKTQSEFYKIFPGLIQHLKPMGMLWVSWPKSGQDNTDLNLIRVIKIGYDYGLVESKCISINTLWSALKFTHPKKGNVYNNSYGKLKRMYK